MLLAVDISPTVTLRLVEEADASQLAAAYVRNRQHLAPWEPERPDAYFAADWHEGDIAGLRAAYHAGFTLPLVLAAGDTVIGRVTLSGIVRGAFQSASLGYWIDEQHAGRGLMSAAVNAVLVVARDNLRLHRIEAATLVHNAASQRVLFRAGFEQIGLAPRYLRIAGAWQDHVLFQRILENGPDDIRSLASTHADVAPPSDRVRIANSRPQSFPGASLPDRDVVPECR